MPTRKSEAEWKGNLKGGNGHMKLGSGAFDGQFSFGSRFESGTGTNPEELVAAALAGCYSMALSAGLEKEGHTPVRVHTTCAAHLNKVGDGFEVNPIDLRCEAEVPGLDEATFKRIAEATKQGCPISKLYKGATINLEAHLKAPQRA